MSLLSQFAGSGGGGGENRQRFKPEQIGDHVTAVVGRIAQVKNPYYNPNQPGSTPTQLVVDFDQVQEWQQDGQLYQPPAEGLSMFPSSGAAQAMSEAGVGDLGGEFITLALSALKPTDKGNPFKEFQCTLLGRVEPQPQAAPVAPQAPVQQPQAYAQPQPAPVAPQAAPAPAYAPQPAPRQQPQPVPQPVQPPPPPMQGQYEGQPQQYAEPFPPHPLAPRPGEEQF